MDGLDIVLTRARRLWNDPVVWDWLRVTNAYLDGARPIDVLQLRGPDEVLAALDAAEQSAFG